MNFSVTTKTQGMKNKKNLEDQLSEYMVMRSSQQITHKIVRGSLMLMAPFAASTVLPTVMQAQTSCGAYPGGMVTSSGTFASCPDIYIDIDGDGSADFNIFGGATLVQINGINGNILGNTASGYAYAGNASGTFTAGSFPSSFTAASLTYPAYGNGNFPLGGSGFIPIIFNGNLGWIEVTLDAAGCVTVGTFGVEDAIGGSDGLGTVVAGDCNTLLPVDLMDLGVETSGTDLVVVWKTASEINNQGFEVQRSTDGKKFKKVGFISGRGTSYEINDYSYTDKDAKSNQMYYYRLKQVDFDGRFDFTRVVSAKVTSKQATEVFDIFPNPASNGAELNISLNAEQSVAVKIFDQRGNVMSQQNHQLAAGNHMLRLDLLDMATGLYFVQTQVNEETFYKKLVVN